MIADDVDTPERRTEDRDTTADCRQCHNPVISSAAVAYRPSVRLPTPRPYISTTQTITIMVQLPATAAIEYVAAGHFFPWGLLAGGIFVREGLCPGRLLSGGSFDRGIFFPGGLLPGGTFGRGTFG